MPNPPKSVEELHTVPSSRPPTLEDLGKILGLSKRAVSQALHDRPGTVKVSEKTRARVVALAKSMGYRPNTAAKSLTTGRTGLFGILASLGKMHISSMNLASAVEIFREKGVMPLVITSRNSSEEDFDFAISSIINARVDGVVLMHRSPWFQELHLEELRKYGMSVVQVGGGEPVGEISHYNVDWSKAYAPALNHLLEQGFTRIGGLIANDRTLLESTTASSTRQRTRFSMLEAVNEARNRGHNFQFQIFDYASNDPAPSNLHPLYQAGYFGMTEVIRRGEVPEAMMFQVDGFAFGAMRACQEAGLRIPQDMALTGYSNEPGSSAGYVPITSIEEPFEEMCAAAIQELLAATAGGRQTERKRVMFPTRLVVRSSSLRNGG